MQNLLAQPCKEVVGYYCNWQWYDRNKLVNPMTIPYNKYTIINYAFLNPQPNGTIALFDAWADENILLGPMNWNTGQPNTTQSLPYQAHLNNVKVLASIGGWTLSNNFPGIAADPVKRATFASHCRQLISTYNFDGIDIDWEYPGYVDHGGTPADKVNYTTLLQQVRDTLTAYGLATGKNYLLTAALPAGPSNMANIQWAQVANILDILNIMTYDFFGTWDNTANHNSPLYAPQQGDPALNCHTAVQTIVNTFGVPRSKITLGVPFYGRSVKTVNAPALFGTIYSQSDNITFPEDDGTPLYYNILPRLSQFNRYWDNQAQVPYLLGKNTLYTFVSYDDTASIALKAQYINSQNLRGAIVWEITGDVLETVAGSGIIASTPLANALNTTLCGGTVSTCPVPTGVSAGNITSSGATVNWTSVTGNSYMVFWKKTSDALWNSANAGGSSYVLGNLLACTPYDYKVRTTCPNGSTSESAVQSFQTTGCCQAPSGLASTSITSSSATLSWSAVTGATSYIVQYKSQASGSWTNATVTGTSTVISGLMACTGYEFQVRTVCGSSQSAFSPSTTFQTLGCSAPCVTPVPGAVSAIGNTSATLSWSNTSAVGYSLQYRVEGTTGWTTATTPTTSYGLTNLTTCRTYEWRVASVCTGTALSYSPINTFGTSGCTNTCKTVPSGLSVTPVSNTSVNVSWANTGSSKYRIQYRLQSATTWTSKTVTGTTTSITRLTACSNYVWRVRSECTTSNVSLYSPTSAFTTGGCSVACNTPTGLTVSSIGNSQAQVSWNSTSANSYRIEYKTSTATAWTALNSTTTSVNISGLISCTSYQVRVSSVCGTTTSNPSSTVTFTTTGCSSGGPAPSNYCSSYSLDASSEYIQLFRVSNLNHISGNNNGFGNFINMTASLQAGRSDTLRFAAGFSTSTTYQEYWTVLIDFNRNGSFTDPGETVAQTISSGTNPQQVVFATPPGASTGGARLRVQMRRGVYAGACDVYTNGEVEDYLVDIAPSGSRMTEPEAIPSVELFPNPASESIQIRFLRDANQKSVRILNATGQEVGKWMVSDSHLSLPVDGWVDGVYIVQYVLDGQTGFIRFIKD